MLAQDLRRSAPAARPAAKVRWPSVDALRGSTVAAMLLVNNPGDWGHTYAPLLHADWHGCTPTDLVFPFFLFVVGVSTHLSQSAALQAGAAISALRSAALGRALRIFALGLALQAVAHFALGTPALRIFGVLQRIGLCYGAVALLALYVPRGALWGALGALLASYWGILLAGGTLEPQLNIASRLDAWLLGVHAYRFDAATGLGHEPEGLLSTLPAIGTTLLGLLAGEWLRARRTQRLLAAGVGALALAWLWSYALPFNKQLWTPSYVLWSGGFALLALAACHWLIDVRGWPPLGRAFGMNAITAYAGSALMVYALLSFRWAAPLYSQGFRAWIEPLWGPYVASLAYALAVTALWWAIARALDRRRWYLKI